MQHRLDDAGLGPEPVGEFTDEIVVAGVMREPRAGVDDAVLNEPDDALEIGRHCVARGLDGDSGL